MPAQRKHVARPYGGNALTDNSRHHKSERDVLTYFLVYLGLNPQPLQNLHQLAAQIKADGLDPGVISQRLQIIRLAIKGTNCPVRARRRTRLALNRFDTMEKVQVRRYEKDSVLSYSGLNSSFVDGLLLQEPP
jgi:hypothetical protein